MTRNSEPYDRLTAYGYQLIDIHATLREELAQIRAGIDSIGTASIGTDSLGTDPSAPSSQLRSHCLAFCSALGSHHAAEDSVAFAVLGEQYPDLRAVLDELQRDHVVVAAILRRLDELVNDLQAGRNTADLLRAELDGLAAVLESHFVYEERRLVDALNTLDPRAYPAHALLGPVA